jgi:hypothetical protein
VPIFHGVANYGRKLLFVHAADGGGREIAAERPSDRRIREWANGYVRQMRARKVQRQLMQEALSPSPSSAVEIRSLLKGQMLFDRDAGRILEHLGLHPTGRNRTWRGPVYDSGTGAQNKELDTSMPGWPR